MHYIKFKNFKKFDIINKFYNISSYKCDIDLE